MTLDESVEAVQFAYPQIFYACHTQHVRKRSSDAHLSPRDSQILVHLDPARPMSVTLLARHMGLAASTVSEAVARLHRFGYLTKNGREAADRRRVGIVVTPKGRKAVQASSVLETARLRAVLTRLSPADRTQAIRGLARLARACRPSIEEKGRWHDG